jgi:hypothetical protein
MRKIYVPVKDASLYEEFNWRNTGLDEILEIGKSATGAKIIRSLIQFDIPTLSASVAAGTIPASASFDLKLFVARADDLRYGQTFELAQVSRSWVEGTGYYYQNTNTPFTSSRAPAGGYFENDGVTWISRQSGSTWSTPGGETYATTQSVTIAQPVEDITVDITSFVRSHISGTVDNYGLCLRFPSSSEADITNRGNIRFFSRNTHTVYSPQLIAKWNDQQYITGSISASSIPSQLSVLPRNLRPEYRVNDVVRVDFSVRDTYPVRTFDTQFSNYDGTQRLPVTSYYSIVDQQSNTIIIPFDDYSRISSDGTGSFAKFTIHGMYPGRYYKMLVKVVDQDYEQIFDLAHTFRVSMNR